ncbi:MAG: xanthine dehydrogenase family protein subunit M [Coprothermobacterota bacterium]|nr:xanthine dehydrogenase family protein subunit M [Coprothermobacterota bacterium]
MDSLHLPAFQYQRPGTLREALELLSISKGPAFPLAGGTDLLVQLRSRPFAPECLFVDLGNLTELRGVQLENNNLQIGALATHAQLAASPLIQAEAPLLAWACARVGTPQTRTRGTLGGNVVHASPAADTIPPLLVHEAILVICSPQAKRRSALDRFLLGPYRTTKRDDEVLVAFSLPRLTNQPPAGCYRYGYQRLIRRQAVGIARIIVAAALRLQGHTISEARLACGAVTPVACRLGGVEEWLRGKEAILPVFQEAGERASREAFARIGPRWSTPYKQPVLASLVRRALQQAGDS